MGIVGCVEAKKRIVLVEPDSCDALELLETKILQCCKVSVQIHKVDSNGCSMNKKKGEEKGDLKTHVDPSPSPESDKLVEPPAAGAMPRTSIPES